MLKKTVFAILAIVMITMLLVPVQAWVYPDGSNDNAYETYGPHADKMLIKCFASDTAEFAAMAAGTLDICDWPVSPSSVTALNKTGINLVSYGPEYGIYVLDMNENNETLLGNVPYYGQTGGPVNPIVQKYGTCWTADVWLRRAIDYLLDRPAIVSSSFIGAHFGAPMYTGIPIVLSTYVLPVVGNTSIPWAWSYDPHACNLTLDAHGYPMGPSGFREYRGKVVHLIAYIRSDDVGRNYVGSWLQAKMTAAGFDTSGFQYVSSDVAYEKVMAEEDFHIYTAGWSLSADPDLTLWWYALYWIPGDTCGNYDAIHDPNLDSAAANLYTAANQTEAIKYAKLGQWYMALNAHAPPVYCKIGTKAVAKWNVGGHGFDTSENQNWLGVVNDWGYGTDNGYSYLDMHTNLTSCGHGMTIDYGFKALIKKLNPIYSSWLFDWNFMGNCFESLLTRNGTDVYKKWQNWMTDNFTTGLYTHPAYGVCSKIRITLKPGLLWSDGEPLTMADIRFSLDPVWASGCRQMLLANGYPNPYWYGSIMDILSFTQLDPLTFEVLEDVKSMWAIGWVGGAMIIPEHIWKPIIQTGNPKAQMPDPHLVGNGPWKYVSYDWVTTFTGELDRNPYYRRGNCPVDVSIKVSPDWRYKFLPSGGLSPIVVTLTNLNIRGNTTVLNFTLWVTFSNATTKKLINAWTGNITAEGVHVFTVPWTWTYGKYKFRYELESKTHPDEQSYSQDVSGYVVYCTITEDVAGTTYFEDIGMTSADTLEWPYRGEVPAADIKVDVIGDIARVAGAFGSYPGHPKWSTVCDVDGNYKVDIFDVGRVAAKFGWHP